MAKKLPVLQIDQFNEKNRGSFFYANTLEEHLKKHHIVHVPHKHDFFLVVMFTHGSGIHTIDFAKYKIKPGSVFLLTPGQMHDWKLSDDCCGYVFFHTREFYNLNFTAKKVEDYLFFSSTNQLPVIYLRQTSTHLIETRFEEILHEFNSGKLLKMEKLLALVDLLYIDLIRNYKTLRFFDSKAGSYMDKFKKLERLVDLNYLEIKSPGVYASKMNMTEKHLNRICKTCVNKTTSELISDRVVLEAKRLMVQTKNPISAIAEQLGFDDLAYFSRVFKKKTGKSPTHYLKSLH